MGARGSIQSQTDEARTTVNGDCIHLGITTRYYGHSDAKRMVKMVHAKMRSKEL